MDNKKYFEVFTEHQNDKFELYNEIKNLIHNEIVKARGETNAKFYDLFRMLSNSENNAGWEDRHNERISFINKVMAEISEDYEEFLP